MSIQPLTDADLAFDCNTPLAADQLKHSYRALRAAYDDQRAELRRAQSKALTGCELIAEPAALALSQARDRLLSMTPPDRVAVKEWRLHLIDGWIKTHAAQHATPWDLCELAGLHLLRAQIATQP